MTALLVVYRDKLQRDKQKDTTERRGNYAGWVSPLQLFVSYEWF